MLLCVLFNHEKISQIKLNGNLISFTARQGLRRERDRRRRRHRRYTHGEQLCVHVCWASHAMKSDFLCEFIYKYFLYANYICIVYTYTCADKNWFDLKKKNNKWTLNWNWMSASRAHHTKKNMNIECISGQICFVMFPLSAYIYIYKNIFICVYRRKGLFFFCERVQWVCCAISE